MGQQKLSGKGKILLAGGIGNVLYRSFPTRQDDSLHPATTRTSKADQPGRGIQEIIGGLRNPGGMIQPSLTGLRWF
jgi:hypothetical protein